MRPRIRIRVRWSIRWSVFTFLGSGPDRGRSPEEWGDFQFSVCPFIRPFVRPFVPPSGPSSQA